MTECANCLNKTSFRKRGTERRSYGKVQRLECRFCGSNIYERIDEFEIHPIIGEPDRTKVSGIDRDILIFTSAQNNQLVNRRFLRSLEKYAERRNARIFIIPNRYAVAEQTEIEWDESIEKYLMAHELTVNDNLKVLGNINISATAVHPLSGLTPLTAGKSTIVGHPQLSMTTVPVNKHRGPIVLTTTGSITYPAYRDNKAGYKAKFHHSFSAIVVELDGDKFHMRQLCADKTGSFYDLGELYTPGGYQGFVGVDALVTGDEHVIQMSEESSTITYGVGGTSTY